MIQTGSGSVTVTKDGQKSKQVILIVQRNTGTSSQQFTVNVNSTNIVNQTVPQGDSYVFSTEKLLLEDTGDNVQVQGTGFNFVVSYQEY